MMTVGELYDLLHDLVDAEDGAKHLDRPILGVHQPSYPLQETIAGIYDPTSAGEREYVLATQPDDECVECEKSVQGQMTWHDFDEDDQPRWTCDDCTTASMEGQEHMPLYIVVSGQPYDLSPYGPRRAFSEVQR